MRRDEAALRRGTGKVQPCLVLHSRDVRVEPLLGLGVDHRADMGRDVSGIADLQLARRARDHLDHAVGDVLLHEQQPQRRAALAGRSERGGDDIVGDLLGQRGGIGDHGVDAAGLRDQRHDRSVLGGERPVDVTRDLGRAGEDDAGDLRMRGQRRTDAAVAGDEVQCAFRDAGLVQQRDGRARDARCLLGGLCHDAVAGHQRRGDLAEENRQRKIPRRDRDKDAAAAHGERIALAGRARHCDIAAEQLSALRGIIAAEIGGLAHFRERVVERLAALALKQREEMRAAALQQMRGLLQRRRARRPPASGSRLQSLRVPQRSPRPPAQALRQ